MAVSGRKLSDLQSSLSLDSAVHLNHSCEACLTIGFCVDCQKNLTHLEEIYIKPTSVNITCFITGCAALSCNKLMLADNRNSKLKVVDVQSKAVIEEKKLDSQPWDIAAMPRDHIAVTMPWKREILLMTAASKLSAVKQIPVQGNCVGVTHHHNQLYVVCQDPNIVLVLDTQGNVQNRIFLNNDIFSCPDYILVSEDSRHIYISDYSNHSVVSITLQADVSSVYKHKDLSRPQGMLMLEDGSLLVCSYNNDTIHHISGNLKQGQVIIGDLPRLRSICYSHQHDKVYIGGSNDQLKVYTWK